MFKQFGEEEGGYVYAYFHDRSERVHRQRGGGEGD
jgi:hypothetical protein